MKQQLLPPSVKPIFELGNVVVTSQALIRIPVEDISVALGRHASGDWGDMSDMGKRENDAGLKHGFRLLSVYHDRHGIVLWVITEANRKTTTVLLPADY
jgi:hypothetical protein